MAKAKIEVGDIVRLYCNLCVPQWRKGLEQDIHSIDGKLWNPLPEKYLKLPLGFLDLEIAF